MSSSNNNEDEMDSLFDAFDGVEEEKETAQVVKSNPQQQQLQKESDEAVSKKRNVEEISASSETPPKQEPQKSVAEELGRHLIAKSTTNTKTTKDSSSSSGGTKINEVVSTGTADDKSIRSYSAYPANYTPSVMTELPPFAHQYPFELDPFQATSIDYIRRNESVLVAAHTSAGKTVVAEYSIAHSLKKGSRVIYTSPIKALSNQKYRDFSETFGAENVGLMTGDMTINPDGACIVMTTEILRSMLYRGSEMLREVSWVVYDEVHYMRDRERGVVWEESIILLPHQIRFVFLSATIPNAKQFADWVCKIHHQPCHVVYTNYRPTPLQHYIFPDEGEGLYLVVDEKGKFRESNFVKAMSSMKGNSSGEGDDGGGGGGGRKSKRRKSGGGGHKDGDKSKDLFRIVKLVMERNLNPVIIFSFSKKDCEKYALDLRCEDFNPDSIEKDLVTQVYKNAIESLSEDDQQLPQVEALLPLLKRGIGIHHGGLLPILKEIVEILFSEGLIKCLFATETFSIGINMPAKTVVFTNCRKFDGAEFRWVTSGEYIQMSGRAGRRGKDDRGIVIQMLEEKMEPDVCKGILYGDPDPLNSSYKISYNMLLNMMRVEEVDPEYLIRASFHQFQQESEAPAIEAEAKKLEEEACAIKFESTEDENLTKEFYQMQRQLESTNERILKLVRKPEHILPYLSQGRIIHIVKGGEDFGWGTLFSCKKRAGSEAAGISSLYVDQSKAPSYILEVLLVCVPRSQDEEVDDEGDDSPKLMQQAWRGSHQICRPFVTGKDDDKIAEMRVFTCKLEHIHGVSQAKMFINADVVPKDKRLAVMKNLNEINRRFPDGLPLIDPVKDMGIKSEDFDKFTERRDALNKRITELKFNELYDEEERSKRLEMFENKSSLLEQSMVLKREARTAQGMVMRDDLKKMKKVLRELDYVDVNGVIKTKGRTACEINTADELVVVEVMFSGLFSELTVEQSVALLSCFVYGERPDDDKAEVKAHLLTPFRKLQDHARVVANAMAACKIEINEDDFVARFNPSIMEAVHAWCKGAKFIDVQQLTDSYEGNTIRTLRRLEELVRQLGSAAKAVGNHELQAKFEKGCDLLKRDIVFCSSLYL